MSRCKSLKVYDLGAPAYNFLLNWVFEPGRKQVFNFIDEDEMVLDFGCGTGALCKYINARNYVGVDGSKQMLRIAQSNYSGKKFIKGDIEGFELTQKADVIVLAYVLSVTDNPSELIANCYRNLKDGGKLIILNYFSKSSFKANFNIGFNIGFQYNENWFKNKFSLSHKEAVNLFKWWDLLVFYKE